MPTDSKAIQFNFTALRISSFRRLRRIISPGAASKRAFQCRQYEANKEIYRNCERLIQQRRFNMSIYYELIRRVEAGETFHIDFEKRNMKVGKEFLVKDGDFDTSRKLMDMNDCLNGLDDVIRHIEEQYEFYKFSLPSERSDSKRKKYFKALPIEKIPDNRLFAAGRREVEQARLEGFILCSILTGKFEWDEQKLGKWFYQSKNDPDLVILKIWIENN